MENEIKKIAPKKEKMTQEKVFELIQEWIEHLEVRLKEDEIEDVKQEIWMAVKNDRLTFNKGKEVFKYALKKPILDVDEKAIAYSILYVREARMKDKREMSKAKTDIDAAVHMFKSYCVDENGEKIEFGFLERLYERDMQILLAIILGFFVQAVPGVSPK